MSRAAVAGAIAALEGLALGYEDSGQGTRAAHIRSIQLMLESDLLERDAERLRSRSRRDRRSTDVRPAVESEPATSVRPPNDRQTTGVRPVVVGGRGEISLSSEIRIKSERESAGARDRPAVAASEPERHIQPTDAITPELMEIAKMALVQDIPGAWLKFCGYHAGKWAHVVGKWQIWCVNEAKAERTQRDRMRPGGPADPGDVYHQPEAVAARQRARDREHEALKRQRAGPQQVAGAVGGLLAALGPRPIEEKQPKKVNGGAT